MKALVIDDSRAVRLILRNYLAEAGIPAAEAGDGRDGLDQLLADEEIGLVLVDWNMPVMDGLQFITEVRRRPLLNHVKLVMVTTESESDQVLRATAAGADEYIMKPFTKEVLVAKLSLLDVLEG